MPRMSAPIASVKALPGRLRWRRPIAAAVLLLAIGGCGADSTPAPGAAVTDPADAPAGASEQQQRLLTLARGALVASLGPDAKRAQWHSAEALQWVDSSMGCDTDAQDADPPEQPLQGHEVALLLDGERHQVQVAADGSTRVCEEFQGFLAPRRQTLSVRAISTMQQQAAEELAAHFGIAVSAVQFGRTEPATWPDQRLGCEAHRPLVETDAAAMLGNLRGLRFDLIADGQRVDLSHRWTKGVRLPAAGSHTQRPVSRRACSGGFCVGLLICSVAATRRPMSDTTEPVVFDPVEDALRAIAAGEMVVVVDDDDRENEGDLIMAASKATSDKVAFMIRHTSGILCTPILEEQAKALQLQPMVARNDAPMSTAFTVSIDYKEGLTTGISAEERANTVVALTSNNVSGADFVRPGHIFPLVARRGGVLVRSGHTEAGTDLSTLAGLPPVSLLAEIVNDDGTVKRLPELVKFAAEHELKIISIADLIAYRQRREQLVERVHEFEVRTRIGPAQAYAYKTRFEDAEHLALVFGDIASIESVPVRIHREKLITDLFGPQTDHPSSLLEASLDKIEGLGGGVFIYLRSGFVGVPMETLKAASREDERRSDWLEVGVGAQILRDLGVSKLRLIAGREVDYVGVEGFGLTLDSTELLNG